MPTRPAAARSIVDAESAAEIAACADTGAPVASSSAPPEQVTLVIETRQQEECVVDAENPSELEACFDTTLGTTYDELRRTAESASELADIPNPEPAPFQASASARSNLCSEPRRAWGPHRSPSVPCPPRRRPERTRRADPRLPKTCLRR